MKSTCECPCLRRKPGEVGGDLALGATGELHADDLLEARVGRGARRGQPLELVVALDRAQHRQRVRHRDVARPGQRALEAEQVHRPGRVGDGVAAVRLQERRRRRVRVVPVRPVVQRQRAGGGCGLGVGPLEDRHDHGRLARGGHDEHRDALGDRDRRVAGQVQQVGPGRHEHAGQLGVRRLPRRALEPPRRSPRW